MNLRIVRALLIKTAFVWSRSTFRVMDVFFWPLIDLLVWGYLTAYMLKVGAGVPSLITFFIAAIILWNVLYRAQQVISVSFLDDAWSRNLLNIFVAPIRTSEYIGAAYIVGLIQSLVIVCFLGGLAILVYSYNLFALGFNGALLFCNLILMGWSLGLLTTGFILRFGQPAEGLAWALPFLIQPVSAVFYPLSILPTWLQPIACCIPSTHVFEGMRQIVAKGFLDWHYLQNAFLLNIVYMIVCAIIFNFLFEETKRMGNLGKYGQ
jgi:ABC-2 type transport system permease protein